MDDVFRKLKYNPEEHAFFERNKKWISSIGSKDWNDRISYPDQLLENKSNIFYLVYNKSDSFIQAPDISILAFSDIVIFKNKNGIINSEEREIEVDYAKITFHNALEYYVTSDTSTLCIPAVQLNIFPYDTPALFPTPGNGVFVYSAIFLSRESAEEYATALNKHFRTIIDIYNERTL